MGVYLIDESGICYGQEEVELGGLEGVESGLREVKE